MVSAPYEEFTDIAQYDHGVWTYFRWKGTIVLALEAITAGSAITSSNTVQRSILTIANRLNRCGHVTLNQTIGVLGKGQTVGFWYCAPVDTSMIFITYTISCYNTIPSGNETISLTGFPGINATCSLYSGSCTYGDSNNNRARITAISNSFSSPVSVSELPIIGSRFLTTSNMAISYTGCIWLSSPLPL